uniref:Cell cycle control protein n=1 Tax=Ciona savignyi TaxID=51511 RepID=H2ZJC1_CIOSA
ITEEKTQKHLPDNTAFKQQRLPAWAPILSAKSTLPIFFIVSIAFVPIGVVLLVTSEAVVEFQYDYTDCIINQSSMTQPCTCVINITLGTSMDGNVYAYYGLTNFFQNHRRYVKSRDDNQLFGVHVATTSVSTSCAPYNLFNDNGTIRPIAPCGAIANSMFNDTFTFSQGSAQVPIVRTGIAWPTDYSVKFNNPFPTNDLDQAFSQYAKPSNWQKPVQSLDRNLSTNNGYKNEAFIVWMRTAAFSHFRKPYGILNRVAGYTNGLPSGQYTLLVDYNFPVTAFGGRKRFILSTTSWMGGKNSFLGVAYIVFGGMCFIGGILLTMIHLHARNTREMSLISRLHH